MTGSMDPTQHPQPLLRRPWTSLNGEWDFAPDPEVAISAPGRVRYDSRILVPFAPETPASGIGWKGPLRRAWYRRGLPGHSADARTLLHFGAVDRAADVWVNGVHVTSHEGGYSPWAVDITEHLGEDGAELVVRADDDPLDFHAPRGKQDWRDESHFIWYPRTTGIWRTPWLERVSSSRISNVEWSCDTKAYTVTARISLVGNVAGHRLHLRLKLGSRVLIDDTAVVTQPQLERTFALGDGTLEDRVQLLWNPASPTLLDAELALADPTDAVVDEVLSYTALRSVSVEDGRFAVNGRPVPLRLVLDQGYWPDTGATPRDSEALRLDLELTRRLGFTGARKHQKTEDPRYYAWADRMGLMVWAEMPSAYAASTTSATRLLREWAEVIAAHRGHPSVVAWVPINESWGTHGIETDARKRALVTAMGAVAIALDGSRPVSANDGWETIGGDLLGIHDYEQDASILAERYRTVAAIDVAARTRRSDGKLNDLDRAGQDGRAVVLSEFGGISLDAVALSAVADLSTVDGTEAWGYTTAASPEEFLARYRELWAAVNSSEALAGACWTQLTDTYQEVNGLLRADRSPKIDLDAVAAATNGAGRGFSQVR